MTSFHIEPAASTQLDEIYDYTADRWGEDQADHYIRGMFERFGAIAAGAIPRRRVPAGYGVDGYYCRYEHHVIYWKQRADGRIAVALILHERMDQVARIQQRLGAVSEPGSPD